jgi:hypothetical protein
VSSALLSRAAHRTRLRVSGEREVREQLHEASSSVARLAWRLRMLRRFSFGALRRHLSVGLPVFGGAMPRNTRAEQPEQSLN